MFSIAKYAMPAVTALSCHTQQEGKAEKTEQEFSPWLPQLPSCSMASFTNPLWTVPQNSLFSGQQILLTTKLILTMVRYEFHAPFWDFQLSTLWSNFQP